MRVLRTLIDHETGIVRAVVRVSVVHPLRGAQDSDETVELSEIQRGAGEASVPADLPAEDWSNADLATAIEKRHALRPGSVTVADPQGDASKL